MVDCQDQLIFSKRNKIYFVLWKNSSNSQNKPVFPPFFISDPGRLQNDDRLAPESGTFWCLLLPFWSQKRVWDRRLERGAYKVCQRQLLSPPSFRSPSTKMDSRRQRRFTTTRNPSDFHLVHFTINQLASWPINDQKPLLRSYLIASYFIDF